jgi:hypothetical protein
MRWVGMDGYATRERCVCGPCPGRMEVYIISV